MHDVVETPMLGKEAKDITTDDLKKIDLHGIIGRSIDTYMDEYKGAKYENPLVGVAVTANISRDALDSIFCCANMYMEAQPILKILDKATQEEWRQWGPASASTCPVPVFTSPFIGKTTEEMVQIIRANHESTCINGRWFYIVDQQTAYDSTLLLVEIPLFYPETPRSVRVFPALANCEAEILINTQGGFQYLLDAAINKKVYHGYEYILNCDFEEETNPAVAPLLRNMSRPANEINVIDPVAPEPSTEPSSDDGDQLPLGVVDIYHGLVDNSKDLKKAYPPSECDTIIADFLDELEQNSEFENNGFGTDVEGENSSLASSDEGYVEDIVGNAEAIASQFTLDEGYFEDGNIGHVRQDVTANDDSYYLSDDGSANGTGLSCSV